jgi:hypothetical protein
LHLPAHQRKAAKTDVGNPKLPEKSRDCVFVKKRILSTNLHLLVFIFIFSENPYSFSANLFQFCVFYSGDCVCSLTLEPYNVTTLKQFTAVKDEPMRDRT